MSWETLNPGGRFRVIVTKKLPGERWRGILTEAGAEISYSTSRRTLGVDEIRTAIGSRCDGAIGQLTEPWGAELFEALKRAGGRAYSNYAVGYDNVRVDEATSRGIAVGNTPGVLTETTAELAVALTLAAARRIGESERSLRAGEFTGWLPDLFLGKRFHGGTLGIIGAGRIGTAYAKMMAGAFSMDVVYWSRSRAAKLEAWFLARKDFSGAVGERVLRCRRVEQVDELLGASDVVAIHVPLSDATRHLIDRDRLAQMKEDAVLVNTARGPIIDEAALVAHLSSHPRFRAGLDVFEHEPVLAPGLVDCENAVLVPHIGSATDWTREGMATLAAANVAGILLGRPVLEPFDVAPFLREESPRWTPSIVNREALGIATG
jgi:hydroxypyruvate reductase 1